MDKTNVMRILDSKKIAYTAHEYAAEITEGTLVAATLGEDPARVFKTLVTVSGSGAHYVFVIPVEKSLDLKAAARAAHEKSVSMIKQKDLLPLTGYIHGGCSPVGMKKAFPTVIDNSAESFETIFVSAGKVGRQVCLSPALLVNLIRGRFAELTLDN